MLIMLIMMAHTSATKKFSNISPVRLSEALNQTARKNIFVSLSK